VLFEFRVCTIFRKHLQGYKEIAAGFEEKILRIFRYLLSEHLQLSIRLQKCALHVCVSSSQFDVHFFSRLHGIGPSSSRSNHGVSDRLGGSAPKISSAESIFDFRISRSFRENDLDHPIREVLVNRNFDLHSEDVAPSFYYSDFELCRWNFLGKSGAILS